MVNQPLRGLVGQGLGGPKAAPGALVTLFWKVTGGSYTLGPYAYPVIVSAFLYGAGGAGDGGSKGGGGGGAAMVEYSLGAGQTTSVVVGAGAIGANGQASTITLPNGLVVRAGGGAYSGSPPAGGVATNGDLNRTGGVGGDSSNGGAGQFGGVGGVWGGPGGGGGGGSAGFSDLGDYPANPGAQYVGSAAGPSAGGGSGSGNSGIGGSGQIFAIVRKVAA